MAHVVLRFPAHFLLFSSVDLCDFTC